MNKIRLMLLVVVQLLFSGCSAGTTENQSFDRGKSFDLSHCQIAVLDAVFIPTELALEHFPVLQAADFYNQQIRLEELYKTLALTLEITNTSDTDFFVEDDLSVLVKDGENEYLGHLGIEYEENWGGEFCYSVSDLWLEPGESKAIQFYVFCGTKTDNTLLLSCQDEKKELSGDLKVNEAGWIEAYNSDELSFAPAAKSQDEKGFALEMIMENHTEETMNIEDIFFVIALTEEWQGNVLYERDVIIDAMQEKKICFTDNVSGFQPTYNGIFYINYLDRYYRMDLSS